MTVTVIIITDIAAGGALAGGLGVLPFLEFVAVPFISLGSGALGVAFGSVPFLGFGAVPFMGLGPAAFGSEAAGAGAITFAAGCSFVSWVAVFDCVPTPARPMWPAIGLRAAVLVRLTS